MKSCNLCYSIRGHTNCSMCVYRPSSVIQQEGVVTQDIHKFLVASFKLNVHQCESPRILSLNGLTIIFQYFKNKPYYNNKCVRKCPFNQ